MTPDFLGAVHADPWGAELLDLQSLNAGASDAIEREVNRIRQCARERPQALRSTSLVVLGPPGAGKTHLFARLRRRFGPRAVFVHVRPLVGAEMTPRFLLGEVAQQLGYATHGLAQGPVQLNQTHALVGSLLAHLHGADSSFPTTFLSEYQSLDETEREKRLEVALDRVLELWQEADESYLRRLLQVPFATGGKQRALLAWLSGRDCDASQLQRIGATASLSEELCPRALKTLSAVAALGAPIVIVFDQLENLVEAGGSNARLVAYANLAAELVDTMRGLVLVHMALDTEWNRAIEPTFNLSQRSRVVMHRETLSLPSSKEREELIRLWTDRLPDREGPYPWPLSERRLTRLLTEPGITPRMLLVELRRAAEGLPGDEGAREDSNAPVGGDAGEKSETDSTRGEAAALDLEGEWEERLTAARARLDEAAEQRTCLDAARLVDGLLACSRFLSGVTLSPNRARGEPAQLVANVSGETRYVALLHQNHPSSLGSALTKLTTLATRQRVAAVRERVHDLPPTWKATLARRAALLATKRAQWTELEREDAARLLALDDLLQGARSLEVTDERGQPVPEQTVIEWVREQLHVERWEVVEALFGATDTRTEDPVEAPQSDEPSSPSPRTTEPKSSTAFAVLCKLRLASLDRIVREVTRVDPSATRATVINELEALPDRVRWFGRSIVCARVSP